MELGFARVHNGLYLVYADGLQRFEIDNDEGDWQVTIDGTRFEHIWFKDLREAKRFLANIVLREIEESGKVPN